MPIARDECGFLYSPDTWGAPAIGLETERLQACIEEVLARGLTGIFGRYPELQETDLFSFQKMPNLTSVALWDIKLDDLSSIYSLPHLTHFRISGKRPPINFQRLASVRHLVVEHHKKDTGLSALANLKMINLWRFKVAANNAFQFELPNSLAELGVYWSNIVSLEGFGNCPNVKKLTIARCRNLQVLGNLKNSFPKLEHLVIEACGRMTTGEVQQALIGHEHIKHAFAGKQLIVSLKS
ncbi:hypothetical protein [Thalassobius sp. I31.1]|uniref:hypothetical protein n=1 Tax=Thalassobius sp. I31.1 TaxID=2109912 RepID=UPI000D1B9EAE|nr:hypothetical protein [Thalassobius sp. I31.1]